MATADAPPQLGVAPPVRVACIGDSLTLGVIEGYPHPKCAMNKPCRGIYPAILSRLLGPGHEVKTFAIDGGSAHGSWLPGACENWQPVGDRAMGRAEASLEPRQAALFRVSNPQSRARATCMAALQNVSKENAARPKRHTHHFGNTFDILAFKPDIAVVQLGTNDARHALAVQFGEAGAKLVAQTRTRDSLLRLVRVVNASLTILLEPPKVATEAPVGLCLTAIPKPVNILGFPINTNVHAAAAALRQASTPPGCGRFCPGSYTCRYNPAAKYCWRMNTCVHGCGEPPGVNTSDDKQAKYSSQACMRVDLLQRVRAGVRDAAAALEVPEAARRSGARCGGRRAIHAGQAPMPAAWGVFFEDPVHPSPVGTATFACHVHRTLVATCPEHAGGGDPYGRHFCAVVDNATAAIAESGRSSPRARFDLHWAEQALFNESLRKAFPG